MLAIAININLHTVREWNQAERLRWIKSIALHEFGHALGIGGHSDEENDIMYPYFKGQEELTARDVNTIRQLLTLKPDYTRP